MQKYKFSPVEILGLVILAGIVGYYFIFLKTYQTGFKANGPVTTFEGIVLDSALFKVRYPLGITITKTGGLEMSIIEPGSQNRLTSSVSLDRTTRLLDQNGDRIKFSSLKNRFEKGVIAKVTGKYWSGWEGGSRVLRIYASEVRIVSDSSWVSKLNINLDDLLNSKTCKYLMVDKNQVTIFFSNFEAYSKFKLDDEIGYLYIGNPDDRTWYACVRLERLWILSQNPEIKSIKPLY